MFSLIKQVFIVLQSLSSFLARNQTKFLFLNGGSCVVRSILIDMSPVELKYYPFMTGLDKYGGCCKYYDYFFNKFSQQKSKGLLYFSYSLKSNHIDIGNYYYLLSLYKTKKQNIKWKIMNFKKFILKIVLLTFSIIQLNQKILILVIF